MSTLTVVRHGQARPFEKVSDCLSETGEKQARALGEFWKRAGVEFDEVWCGSLTRHRETAALAIETRPATIAPRIQRIRCRGNFARLSAAVFVSG